MGWTLAELSELLGADLRGDGETLIKRPVPAGSDDPEGITFAETPHYLDRVLSSQVGAVIVGREAPSIGKPALLVDSPRLAFFGVLSLCDRPAALPQGIHPSAIIHPEASVSSSARIGACVVVEAGARIDSNATVFPFCYIGPRCIVGEGTRLLPGAVLVQDVVIGDRCVVHSGVVLGTDGFGFVWDGHQQIKIPQVGGVDIGDDVEIGANTAIDRATSGTTKIDSGAKIDNLVQIGHNSSVGSHTVLASQVGISGSVSIGKRVMVGGQAGFADHLTVGDDVVLAGRTGLMSDLLEPGEYFGVPPTPIKQGLRNLALQQRLPDMLSRLRALEREIEKLKNGD